MRRRALHDPLTLLPNRTLFGDRLAHALLQSRRRGTLTAVLFCDIDHFKLINDSLGHAAGDELLTGVAPRLKEALRPGDTVARFGGDEFAVLIEDLADEREAVEVAERIGASFTRPFVLNGIEHFVTASIGIALGREAGVRPETLIRDADAAMYRAKERGRGRYELFDQVMRARAVERLQLENELRRAIGRDELRMRYQPIVSLETGAIVARGGARALAAPATRPDHCPTTSSPPARRPARSSRSGAGCSSGPAGRPPSGISRARTRSRSACPSTCPPARSRKARPAGSRRRDGDHHRPRSLIAQSRDHRERAGRGVGRSRREPGGAARDGSAARDRRLRHRLLVARLPAALPARRDQGRPLLRGGSRHRATTAPRSWTRWSRCRAHCHWV